MILSLPLISYLGPMQRYELKSPGSHGRRDNVTMGALDVGIGGIQQWTQSLQGWGNFHVAVRTGGVGLRLGWGAEVGQANRPLLCPCLE